jgi:hypothetical protein
VGYKSVYLILVILTPGIPAEWDNLWKFYSTFLHSPVASFSRILHTLFSNPSQSACSNPDRGMSVMSAVFCFVLVDLERAFAMYRSLVQVPTKCKGNKVKVAAAFN